MWTRGTHGKPMTFGSREFLACDLQADVSNIGYIRD
jgi:hypothetical protein